MLSSKLTLPLTTYYCMSACLPFHIAHPNFLSHTITLSDSILKMAISTKSSRSPITTAEGLYL